MAGILDLIMGPPGLARFLGLLARVGGLFGFVMRRIKRIRVTPAEKARERLEVRKIEGEMAVLDDEARDRKNQASAKRKTDKESAAQSRRQGMRMCLALAAFLARPSRGTKGDIDLGVVWEDFIGDYSSDYYDDVGMPYPSDRRPTILASELDWDFLGQGGDKIDAFRKLRAQIEERRDAAISLLAHYYAQAMGEAPGADLISMLKNLNQEQREKDLIAVLDKKWDEQRNLKEKGGQLSPNTLKRPRLKPPSSEN